MLEKVIRHQKSWQRWWMTSKYKFAREPLHQCEQYYEFSASYSYTPSLLKQGLAEDTSCTTQLGKFCSPGLVNFELPFINLRWFSLFKLNVSIANTCILRGLSQLRCTCCYCSQEVTFSREALWLSVLALILDLLFASWVGRSKLKCHRTWLNNLVGPTDGEQLLQCSERYCCPQDCSPHRSLPRRAIPPYCRALRSSPCSWAGYESFLFQKSLFAIGHRASRAAQNYFLHYIQSLKNEMRNSFSQSGQSKSWTRTTGGAGAAPSFLPQLHLLFSQQTARSCRAAPSGLCLTSAIISALFLQEIRKRFYQGKDECLCVFILWGFTSSKTSVRWDW